MCLEVRIVAVFVSLEPWRKHYQLKYPLDIAVEDGLVESPVLNTFHDGFELSVTSGLEHVITCFHLGACVLSTEPVGHHHALEAPVVAKNGREQVLALGCIDSVEVVV